MIKKSFSFLAMLSLAVACQTGAENQEVATPDEASQEKSEIEADETGIRIYPKPEVAEFPEAEIDLEQPQNEMIIAGSEVPFDFLVTGYELGAQTEDARMNLANSAKGQHIHLIIDNDPYSAHYDAGFSKSIDEGLHYAIAFLSRSYHESIKTTKAYEVFQFKVGETEEEFYELDQPALFYSRPKGTYSGEGAEKVLLDFYLHNTSLSADGNQVKVVINGDNEFIITEWRPYIIEGLPMGENTVSIELLDSSGNLVDVPINSISRTFTLEP